MTRADRSFRAAQAAYDAMEPPEYADAPCPDCGGRGWTDERDDEGDRVEAECRTCDGRGLVPDADAEHAAEEAAAAYDVEEWEHA